MELNKSLLQYTIKQKIASSSQYANQVNCVSIADANLGVSVSEVSNIASNSVRGGGARSH